MGKRERDRGARGEREVRDLWRKHGFGAIRGRQYSGSPDSPDVKGEGENPIPGWIHQEVKYTERLPLWSAIKQAEGDSGSNQIPLVVFRRNRSKWHAIVDMEVFIAMVADLNKPPLEEQE